MRIICTAEEKDMLVDSIAKSRECPFSTKCLGDDCVKCTLKKIEWEIQEGKKDA